MDKHTIFVRVQVDHPDQQAHPVSPVHPEMQESWVKSDFQDQPDPRDLSVNREIKDHQERMEFLDWLENPDRQVTLESQDQKEPLVFLVFKDLQVSREQLARLAQSVMLVKLANLERRDTQARKVNREPLDQWAQAESQDQLVHPDLKDNVVCVDRTENAENRVPSEKMV